MAEPDSGNSSTDFAPMGYHPGIDGLRGLALLAIIVYHSGAGWAPGAFLSVSTFFTLSGFLITGVMLEEHRRAGAISLRRFWDRRLRRLLPASLLAIALIVVSAALLADNAQLARLRGDALAALTYVANWRFIATGDSYGAGFTSPSPFTHFWTLAIEEQFYVVFPLFVAGTLALARGSRRVLAGVSGALAVASVAWSTLLLARGASIDRVYFGTDTRLAELLLGALLGIWWTGRRRPLGSQIRTAVGIAGPVILIAMLVSWGTASLRTEMFYRGGLAVYAIGTLVVIVGAMQPGSLLHRVLGFRPLVRVGLVSYGAYLVHYPILLWLNQHTGLAAWVRLSIAVPITMAVALISAKWLEMPIRQRRWLVGGRAPFAAVAGVATVGVLVVGTTQVVKPESTFDFAEAQQTFDTPTGEMPNFEALARQGRRERAALASVAPRVASYGDSTALVMGLELEHLSEERPDLFINLGGSTGLGCGLLTEVDRRARGEVARPPVDCLDLVERWRTSSTTSPADVAVVFLGSWDVLDQRPDGRDRFMAIGEDSAFDALLESKLRVSVDTLMEYNGMVVLTVPMPIEAGRVEGRSPPQRWPESDPTRMAAFETLLRRVAGDDPRIRVVRVADGVDASIDDRVLRPDGVHLTAEAAEKFAGWLGPELVRLHVERTGTAFTAFLPPNSTATIPSATAPGGTTPTGSPAPTGSTAPTSPASTSTGDG